MAFEYREKDVWNQLLYYQSLFDVERVTKPANGGMEIGAGGIGGEKREKAKVLAEVNRERFGTAKEVVGRWLERNGRQWVQMDSLFSFALAKGV
jgi:DNA polymerase alpha subunit A